MSLFECRHLSKCLLVLIATGFVCSSASADKIILKSGQEIVGEVLKELEDAVYVDAGVDVIRIPLERIAQRIEDSPKPEATSEVSGSGAGMLQFADLPIRSVKDLVAKFAEGVVLIQNPDGLGSGFIITKDGHCVTNYHVVEGQTRVAVTIFHRTKNGELERKSIRNVKILSLNPHFDLALLQIPEQEDLEFKPVNIATDDSQREGDSVFAIGSPLGLERSVSEGIVSTKNRNMKGLVYIQTTAQINPGNSGGPLFNNRGQVVGVINMKLTFGEGLGFAIPVAYLRHFIHNRDAFAFDRTNPNTGYRYLEPPQRTSTKTPSEVLKSAATEAEAK